jgi:hypothetical protein
MPFVENLDPSFMSFLVVNGICSHIRLIIKCHFWHNAPSQNITKFFLKN